MNPSNTLWTKQYNLYANVDTEGPRYLGFEKWWGGHVLLNAEEMQWIVDNLFVGNKLATAEIVTGDGVRIDLRNIKSPIICFCSQGDDITPPQQALGWILDLYGSVDDIRANGQTIVYCVHDKIGHLGIFVSGGVAKKEHAGVRHQHRLHRLPAARPLRGRADAGGRGHRARRARGRRLCGQVRAAHARRHPRLGRQRPRGRAQVRRGGTALGDQSRPLPDVPAALGARRRPPSSRRSCCGSCSPSRLQFELFSDQNPLMAPVAAAAELVRADRRPVAADNPFLAAQEAVSRADRGGTGRLARLARRHGGGDLPRHLRLAAGPGAAGPARERRRRRAPRPGREPEEIAFVQQRIAELEARMGQGGLREAFVRAIIYIRLPELAADERGFAVLSKLREEHASDLCLADFKALVRDQFLMLELDEAQAVATIPLLLQGHGDRAAKALELLESVVTAPGPLGQEAAQRLRQIGALFTAAADSTASDAGEIQPPRRRLTIAGGSGTGP